MGICLGRFDEFDIATLNELFLQIHPAHLQKLHGKEPDSEERDIVRASYLRSRIAR